MNNVTKQPLLELFYYEQCPYCNRVLQFINEQNIELELKNIHTDSLNLDRLQNETGRKTVPCLFIDNKPMFESNDIIKWLTNFKSDLL